MQATESLTRAPNPAWSSAPWQRAAPHSAPHASLRSSSRDWPEWMPRREAYGPLATRLEVGKLGLEPLWHRIDGAVIGAGAKVEDDSAVEPERRDRITDALLGV